MSPVIAVAPALPLHSAGKYVAAAYIVFVALLLVYVTIMAVRLARTERDVVELNRALEARQAARVAEHRQDTEADREPAAL